MPISKKQTNVKPLLVGEQNPYGGDPEYALYPVPEGCSGQRLCCLILGMYRKDYLAAFERKNLCDGRWDMCLARKRAQELRTWGAPIVLLGSKVARAFGHDPFEPFTVADGGKTLVLPHPSGLCRLWNEAGAVDRARSLVAQVIPSVAHLLGSADSLYGEDEER